MAKHQKPAPLQVRTVQALNRAGLADREGTLYDTSAHNVARFVLRKARDAARRSAFNREAVQLAKMASYFLTCQRDGTDVSGMDWQALDRQRKLVVRLSRSPLAPCLKFPRR